MTPKEQEIAIGELEERVDRLRNIYEQYFLGFEKLEPTVPRKDVDRRLAILRKEQIRNTAMRFRFQVVTQKYNTYSIHWIRICRQIEDGTYKRHIRKAKARFGDNAPTRERERDVSFDVDVDMAEFDSIDLDAVLGAAAPDESDTSDTIPPPAAAPARARPMAPLGTTDTSFALGSRGDSLDGRDADAPPSARAATERLARGAPLPAGARPLILRRRDDTLTPASQRSSAGAPNPAPRPAQPPPPRDAPSAPSLPRAAPSMPGSVPRLRPLNPASTIRGPAPSSPGLEPTSSPRMPASSPAAPSAGRLPLPSPPQASSEARMRAPVPAPSSPGQRARAERPSAPGTRSAPELPPTPRSRPGPPMPSVNDTSPSPPMHEPPPRRPIPPPPPLPSQLVRPTKKE